MAKSNKEVREEKPARTRRQPTALESLILVAFSLGILMYNVVILRGDAHIPLIIATAVVSAYAVYMLGFNWEELMAAIGHGIREIAVTILIYGIIGMMIACWIQAGIIPTLIYYGLKILNPKFFLVLAMIICAIVSTAVCPLIPVRYHSAAVEPTWTSLPLTLNFAPLLAMIRNTGCPSALAPVPSKRTIC